jgi:TonB family protein
MTWLMLIGALGLQLHGTDAGGPVGSSVAATLLAQAETTATESDSDSATREPAAADAAKGDADAEDAGDAEDADAGGQEFTGKLQKHVIQRVIRRHVGAVRFCYERALVKNPKLSGKVVVRFVIDPDGKVTAAEIPDSSLKAPAVEDCILKRVRSWRFPQPEGGAVSVAYPFVFEAKK